MTDPATIAASLSEAQRRIVLESGPGGYGMEDRSVGALLEGPGAIAAGRALERKGLGHVEEGGGGLAWLYFNKDYGDSLGLAVRKELEK